ncbi:hypothetical protein [Nocardia wallacei]|uniref:hypothetical protein n=1 Tax=Nocardia wallacei TaxID=480035 RepID=UPI002458C115|nr:hypothetical protein [Nocardia wallacei]
MAYGGNADLFDPQWVSGRWNGFQAYSDTKLVDIMLAFGVARRWPHALSNASNPAGGDHEGRTERPGRPGLGVNTCVVACGTRSRRNHSGTP